MNATRRAEAQGLVEQGLTLAEVGVRMGGISRQRVAQILHPTKHTARAALAYAIKAGKVTRPSACTECGVVTAVDGHHHDYSLPLEVRWLCDACHGRAHEQQGPGLPPPQPVPGSISAYAALLGRFGGLARRRAKVSKRTTPTDFP